MKQNPPTEEQLKELKNKVLIFYPESSDSPIIDYLINKSWLDILIYCHLEDMPWPLHDTVVEMVLENLATYRWLDNKEDIEDGRIKELSEGDVTIKRLTDEEALKLNASTYNSVVPYYYKLNSYRRIQSGRGWS